MCARLPDVETRRARKSSQTGARPLQLPSGVGEPAGAALYSRARLTAPAPPAWRTLAGGGLAGVAREGGRLSRLRVREVARRPFAASFPGGRWGACPRAGDRHAPPCHSHAHCHACLPRVRVRGVRRGAASAPRLAACCTRALSARGGEARARGGRARACTPVRHAWPSVCQGALFTRAPACARRTVDEFAALRAHPAEQLRRCREGHRRQRAAGRPPRCLTPPSATAHGGRRQRVGAPPLSGEQQLAMQE